MGLAAQQSLNTRLDSLNAAFNEGRLKLDHVRAAKLAELNRQAGNAPMAMKLQKLSAAKFTEAQDQNVSVPRSALNDLIDVLKGLGSLATESVGKRILGPIGVGDELGGSIRKSTEGTLIERPGDALATIAQTVLEPYAKGELSPLEQQVADHVSRQGLVLGGLDFITGFSQAIERIKEVVDEPSILARKPTSTALSILGPVSAVAGGAGVVRFIKGKLVGSAAVEATQVGGALPQAILSLRTRALNRRFRDSVHPSTGQVRFLAPSSAVEAQAEAAARAGQVGFSGSQIVPKQAGGGVISTGTKVPAGTALVPTEGEALRISAAFLRRQGKAPTLPEIRAEAARLLSEERIQVFRNSDVPDSIGPIETELGTEVRLGAREINTAGEVQLPGIAGVLARSRQRRLNLESPSPTQAVIRDDPAVDITSTDRLRIRDRRRIVPGRTRLDESRRPFSVNVGLRGLREGARGPRSIPSSEALFPLVEEGLQARIITRKSRQAFAQASPSEIRIPSQLEPLPISAPTLDVHFGNILLRKRGKGGKPGPFRHVDPGVHGPTDLAKSGFDIAPNLSVRDIRIMSTEHKGNYLTKRWSLMDRKVAKNDFGRIAREARSQGALQGEINEFGRFFNDARELQVQAMAVWDRLSGFNLIDGIDTTGSLAYAGKTVQALDDANATASGTVARVGPGRGGPSGDVPGPGRPTFGQSQRARGLGAIFGKLAQPIHLFANIPELATMVPQFILAQGRHANQFSREMKVLGTITKGLSTRERLWFKKINNGEVSIDDVLRNYGEGRGRLIWDRARQFRDQQDRIFIEAGGNPAITAREHYFQRIYAEPNEIARLLYDAHGGNPAVMLSRTDIHVPESVVANQMKKRSQAFEMARTIDDPVAVQRIYLWQALRRKYMDPLVKRYNDDVLAKVNARNPVIAARASDYIRDALGVPTTAEIALRVKMQGVGSRFTEKFPHSPRFLRETVKTFANTSPSRMVNYVTGVQFLSKFAGKVAFIPVNLGEILSNIPRQIGLFNTVRGFVDAANPWSKGGRELAAFLTDTGLISESPLIDTALWGKWRQGPQLIKDIAAFPVTWSERLNLRVASAGAMRKIIKEMGELPREQFILESIREIQKARPGFFRAARPQVLRRPAGRFLQQFQSYSYFIVETIGRDIAALARARSFKDFRKAAAPMMRLYMLGWAYQSYVEGVHGIDLKNQMGLGWFPFVFWNSRTREWVAKNPGEVVAGPNLGNFFQVYENLFRVLQDDDAAQKLKDPATYGKVILPMLPQLKQALTGETLRDKILGPDVRKQARRE